MDKYKIFVISGLIGSFLLAGLILKFQYDAMNKQKQIERDIIEFKTLEKGIARLESKYVEDRKDLEKLLIDVGVDVSVIKSDLKTQSAMMEAVVVVVGSTPGSIATNKPSDFVESKPPTTSVDSKCTNEHGYCTSVQGLKLDEPGLTSSIPFGTAKFDATNPKPWSLEVFPRKYYSVLTFSKDGTGRTIVHSKMMVETKGIKHEIGLDKSTYSEVFEPFKFHWWNPRIAGTWSFGISDKLKPSTMVAVQLFMSSYANNKSRPRWMFFGIGPGYNLSDKKVAISITPATYNLFPKTNIVQNVHAGATVGMDITGSYSIGATCGLLF